MENGMGKPLPVPFENGCDIVIKLTRRINLFAIRMPVQRIDA